MFLLALLDDLGLPVSANKLTPPTRCLTCLGIEFDIDQACIRIPQDKVENIRQLCESWASKSKATKRPLQSLLGKLLYISKCVILLVYLLMEC